MDTTTGVRLDHGTRERLDQIALPYHTTASALIRVAVDQLIAAVDENGGQLPPIVAVLRDRAEASQPEAAAAAGSR